jgi:hypothetical protein
VHTRAGGRLVGAMSYYSGQDYVRLYYVHEDSCLIPIWYACKADRRVDHDCEREVSACDMMVASLQIRKEGLTTLSAPWIDRPVAPPVHVDGDDSAHVAPPPKA